MNIFACVAGISFSSFVFSLFHMNLRNSVCSRQQPTHLKINLNTTNRNWIELTNYHILQHPRSFVRSSVIASTVYRCFHSVTLNIAKAIPFHRWTVDNPTNPHVHDGWPHHRRILFPAQLPADANFLPKSSVVVTDSIFSSWGRFDLLHANFATTATEQSISGCFLLSCAFL